MCVYIYIRLSSVKWNYVYIYIWAIGKTSIEKCDLGSKLSFLGLHYIVLQYILIASSASPGKLHAESLFTPPLQRLKHLWLPCVFFAALQLYGMVPVNATANHSCTILSQAQKQVWIQLLVRSPDELSQRHAPCLSFTPQHLGSKPSTWSNAFSLAIFI